MFTFAWGISLLLDILLFVFCMWLEARIKTLESAVVTPSASHNKASAPGCKRCGGRVTHGGYCASCHESYYP
jgi:hypothetical protein